MPTVSFTSVIVRVQDIDALGGVKGKAHRSKESWITREIEALGRKKQHGSDICNLDQKHFWMYWRLRSSVVLYIVQTCAEVTTVAAIQQIFFVMFISQLHKQRALQYLDELCTYHLVFLSRYPVITYFVCSCQQVVSHFIEVWCLSCVDKSHHFLKNFWIYIINFYSILLGKVEEKKKIQ